MADPVLHLRLKDNLLTVVKGEGETSQDTLAYHGLVTQHSHSDANHLRNIIIKLWKTDAS